MARAVSVALLADTKQYDAAMARAGALSETTGKRIGEAGVAAGTGFGNGVEKGTTKAGSAFDKLGNSLANWGIPFSSNLKKIGQDLDNVSTHGKGVVEAFSAVGAVGIGALAGLAVESVHISDQFETAQANLESAVKNSGNSWSTYKDQIDGAYKSAAALGFENTDVAEALQTLTTATQSPKKAIGDLATVENIARLRHLSLSDASTQLAKILGGNTRILQQWGINLDIGSGKLHSIQSAEESLQKAQLSLNHVQAEIADGQLKGANASYELANANLSVRNATLNLQQSQQAIPDILNAINERTKDVAQNFGKTLPGEIKVAQAEVHNLGVGFGEFLLPKINAVLAIAGSLLGFFERNKLAADALGVSIGIVLVGAIGAFVKTSATAFIGAIGKMIASLQALQLKVAASQLGMLAEDGSIVAIGDVATGSATKVELLTASLARLAARAALPIIVTIEIAKILDGGAAGSKYDTVSGNTVGSLQKQFQANVQNMSLALANSSLKKTSDYTKGDTFSVVNGKVVLHSPPKKNASGSGGGSAPGSTIPDLGGVPDVTGGTGAAAKKGTASSLSKFLSQVASLSGTAHINLTNVLKQLGDANTLAIAAKSDAAEGYAAKTNAETSAASNAGSAATTIAGDKSQQMVDRLNAAATAINDAAKLQSDAANLQVQAINAQTTAMDDATSAQVDAINDQTQTQVDTLAERGLYGLQLVAQQAKVAVDQQKAIDDANIAAAQAHVDEITAQTNQAVLIAQQKSDTVQQMADQAESKAQANVDSLSIKNATDVASAQAKADAAATQAAITESAAQAHVDAVQFGSVQQKQQAADNQKTVQGVGDKTTAAANAALQQATNTANGSNQDAQDAYSQAQSYWGKQISIANTQLSDASNAANIQQSLAAQSLSAIKGSAAITEAKLTSIYNVDQELASTQFSGGYEVNIYAQPGDGADEYVSAFGWALRTRTG